MTTKELKRQENGSPEPVRGGRLFLPPADIHEDPKELTLELDLPGVEAKDIDIRHLAGVLQIHAKVAPRQAEDLEFELREYETGDYARSFEIGDALDATAITAEHRDGVLTVRLPKTDRMRTKKVEVRAT